MGKNLQEVLGVHGLHLKRLFVLTGVAGVRCDVCSDSKRCYSIYVLYNYIDTDFRRSVLSWH